MPGIPTEVPAIGSTPASASVTNVNAGGPSSGVDGPIVTSLALSGTPSDSNQPIEIAAQQTPVSNLRGDAVSVASPPSDTLEAAGTPNDVNQTVGVGHTQNKLRQVAGGDFNPTSANVITTQQNTAVNQVFGTGVPRNVFV